MLFVFREVFSFSTSICLCIGNLLYTGTLCVRYFYIQYFSNSTSRHTWFKITFVILPAGVPQLRAYNPTKTTFLYNINSWNNNHKSQHYKEYHMHIHNNKKMRNKTLAQCTQHIEMMNETQTLYRTRTVFCFIEFNLQKYFVYF